MNKLSLLIILSVLLLLSNTAGGSVLPVPIGIYPVPATELRDQVMAWCQGSGFRIMAGTVNFGKLSLECSGKKEKFLVEIRPNSPLASFIQISDLTGGADRDYVVNGLRTSLDTYALNVRREGFNASQKTPSSVLSQKDTVFCLSALVRGNLVKCSGFAVGHNGLIITTAHGLEDISELTVWFDNGEKYTGKVVKRDPLRDLTLIKVAKGIARIIPLGKMRQKLDMGDKVFSLVCPTHSYQKVRAGVVDEPPAMVNEQPLWQVDLDVAPGDSGSPVFDSDGILAGVVKGKFRGGWSRGFVIPTNTLKEFLGPGKR